MNPKYRLSLLKIIYYPELISIEENVLPLL